MRYFFLTRPLAFGCLISAAACADDGSSGGDDGTASSGGSTGASSAGMTTAASIASADSTTAPDPTGATSVSASTDGSSSTDSGPASSSDDTGAALCPDIGEPCTICESTQCPDEYCGCYDNGSCVLLAQCAAKCEIGDEACYQVCWTQYPDGISDAGLLTHCAATICPDECGPYMPLTPCQLCLYGECADAMNVCIANPECTALLQCLDACEDPGCENTCYTAHPDGLADSGPVGECAQVACTQECV